MRPSNNLENKTPSDIYWRVQLVYKKFQARSSLEPPLGFTKSNPPLRVFLTYFKLYKWYHIVQSIL